MCQVAPALLLGQEVPDLEGATRCILKDETSELSQLKASLKQVMTQVKLDKVEEFTASMGLFQARMGSARCTLHAAHCTRHDTRGTRHDTRCTMHSARCTGACACT